MWNAFMATTYDKAVRAVDSYAPVRRDFSESFPTVFASSSPILADCGVCSDDKV